MAKLSVTLEDIQQAHARVVPKLPVTPISILSTPRIDTKVHLKLDVLQRTGSFKERGALNTLLMIEKEHAQKPSIIGASAGNHAQAVSYHARKLGMNVSMIMPTQTPINKILSTETWGATVELEGETVDQGIELAKARAEETGEVFIHAFDDPRIIAGQGVCGIEIMQQVDDIDVFVIPVGGGGYISGIATVIKALRPQAKIIGVQTETFPQVSKAFHGQTPPPPSLSRTIADGIAVKGIGTHTLPIMQAYVDDMVLVSDEDIAEAIFYLLRFRKILAEGAGAAGFAALLSGKVKVPKGKKVLTPICGGNIDMNLLSRVIERNFLKDQRLLKVNVVISDRPGGLHDLTKILAKLEVNILNIRHDRVSTTIPYYNAGTELVLETKGKAHAESVIQALEEHCVRVQVHT